jgi:hypothetical protein
MREESRNLGSPALTVQAGAGAVILNQAIGGFNQPVQVR